MKAFCLQGELNGYLALSISAARLPYFSNYPGKLQVATAVWFWSGNFHEVAIVAVGQFFLVVNIKRYAEIQYRQFLGILRETNGKTAGCRLFLGQKAIAWH